MDFRALFRSVTDIDPFEKCLTIASACNLVFRKKFLKEETMAIIPPNGHRPLDKRSNRMKNHICPHIGTRCQNANAANATHLL